MAREREVLVVKGYRGTTDAGVPDFGPAKPDYRPLTPRTPTPDTVDEAARQRLTQSAVNRALHFAYNIGDAADIKIPFPLAEHYQHFPFENHHWDKYGHMESERARVELMLDTYMERSFPTAFAPHIEEALTPHRRGKQTVLESWAHASTDIARTAQAVYIDVKDRMVKRKQPDTTAVALGYPNGYPGAFQSAPILYEVSETTRNQERELWHKALSQITGELQQRNFSNLRAFLNLYGRIKDPITPLTSTLPEQEAVFKMLWRNARTVLAQHGVTNISGEEGQTLVAQLALESSFLALPSAKDIFYVRGDGDEGGEHQELSYVYVNLKDLPRGEFTHPSAVLPRLRELLDDADQRGRLVVTPLAVAHFQTPEESKPTMFLIDGNNRATSLMVMQYVVTSGCTFENRLDPQIIRSFMQKHKLHPGWEREIVLTLEAQPYRDRDGVTQPGFDKTLFARIKRVGEQLPRDIEGRVPALLLQEPNFHTVIVNQAVAEREKSDNPRVPLLQPMHQGIYNNDHGQMAIAIPPKDQTHGRAWANNIRLQVEPVPGPLPQFGSRRHVLRHTFAS